MINAILAKTVRLVSIRSEIITRDESQTQVVVQIIVHEFQIKHPNCRNKSILTQNNRAIMK